MSFSSTVTGIQGRNYRVMARFPAVPSAISRPQLEDARWVTSGDGVRLTFGSGTLKRRQFDADPLDARDPRIDGRIDAEPARAIALRHGAATRQRGRVADTEGPAPRP